MKKLQLILVTSGVALVSAIAGFAGFTWFSSMRQQQLQQAKEKQEKEEAKFLESAKEYLLQEKRTEAIETLEKLLLTVNEKHFEALLMIVSETAESKGADEEEKHLIYLAKLKSIASTDLHRFFVDIYEAAKKMTATSQQQTQTILMEAITRYPNNVMVLTEAISLYFATNQFDKARECCDRIIANSTSTSDSVKAMFCKALSFANPQEREKKMDQLKQALTMFPKFVGALLERASLYAESNRFQEALNDVKKVLDTNPKVAKARLIRASILVVQKKYDEAIDEVNQIVKEHPDDIEAFQTLITIYSTGKPNLEKALEVSNTLMQNLTKSNKNPEKLQDALQYIKLLNANVYMYFGKFDESIQSLNALMAEVQNMPQQASVVSEQIDFCQDVKNAIEKYTPIRDMVAQHAAPYAPYLTKDMLRTIQVKQLDMNSKSALEQQEWSELVSCIAYLTLAGTEDITSVANLVAQLKYIFSNQGTEYMSYLSNNGYIVYAWLTDMLKNMDNAYWLTDQYQSWLKTMANKAQKENSNFYDLVIASLENVE